MNVQEYLALTPDEQAKIAGQLRDKPWNHNIYARKFKTDTKTVWCCHKCDGEWSINQEGEGCSVSTPIPIDSWDEAKALQGERMRDRFDTAFKEVWSVADHKVDCFCFNLFSTWERWLAAPIHYIAACLLAKGILK